MESIMEEVDYAHQHSQQCSRDRPSSFEAPLRSSQEDLQELNSSQHHSLLSGLSQHPAISGKMLLPRDEVRATGLRKPGQKTSMDSTESQESWRAKTSRSVASEQSLGILDYYLEDDVDPAMKSFDFGLKETPTRARPKKRRGLWSHDRRQSSLSICCRGETPTTFIPNSWSEDRKDSLVEKPSTEESRSTQSQTSTKSPTDSRFTASSWTSKASTIWCEKDRMWSVDTMPQQKLATSFQKESRPPEKKRRFVDRLRAMILCS